MIAHIWTIYFKSSIRLFRYYATGQELKNDNQQIYMQGISIK